uniref:Zn(2)-C6 fungal-type domain-containing protein n=1 Tax=Kwoniella bestiolae CBS 10118 TaxID=1296100 RepID=A0A1B9GCU2_9TREE|nr:hypothetical protein I302_00315 [Kwoniella bestiolae CBS 10118]OCF28826.1 hypothetical protein I302_00315 [Kwoniella bestiolae CBS 10118]
METTMDDPGVRLSKACQACRIAKVRCQESEIDGESICVRCIEAGLNCNRVPTRRGRMKGSKNRKTLERLQSVRRERDDRLAHRRMSNLNTRTPIYSTSDAGRTRNDRSLSPLSLVWTRPQSASPSAIPDLLSPSQEQPTSTVTSRRPALDELQQSFPTSRSDQITLPTHLSRPGAIEGDLQNPLLWLAECARQGWDSQSVSAPLGFPPPKSTLPAEDLRLWNQWGNKELFRALHDQQTFFQHGLYGTKRDVSEGLDPVQKGIIDEQEVAELFNRSRSAYLFTVILMVGAIALATLPNSTSRQCQRANQLHTHAEKLQSVLCATAAKSTEIVQAEMLFIEWCLRRDRLVDDQRWARMGWATRLTASIGLQHAGSRSAEELERDSLARNDFRLRVSLILFESRWEAIADRKSVSPDISELSSIELDRLKRCGPFEPEAILAADYALYQFEIDSKERLSRLTSDLPVGYEAEKVWISTFLKAWEDRWMLPHSDSLTRWHYRYVSLRSRLVGLLRISKAQSHPEKWTAETRGELLSLAIQMLEGALCHERALHMIGRTSALVFAATIILQLTAPDAGSRDLILRVALRLAGDPNQDCMTYEKHNGFQLINMLCLSSTARNMGLSGVDQTLSDIPNTTGPPPSTAESFSAPRPDLSSTANTFAWADFEQFFGNSRMDFPYFPTSSSLQSGLGGAGGPSDPNFAGLFTSHREGESQGHAAPVAGGDAPFAYPVLEGDPAMGGYMEYLGSMLGN